MPDPDWSNLSVGVAAIVSLVYVVRVLRNMQRDVLKFFGNHMSKMVATLEDVASTMATLNERVDRLHDDNVRQAMDLRHADKAFTRKVEEQNETSLRKRVEAMEDNNTEES